MKTKSTYAMIRNSVHIFVCMWFFVLFIATLFPVSLHASELSVAPAGGTFTVGSTFDVSFLLNTKGKDVNAVDLIVNFPPDKLQLVSPSAGNSIVGIWTTHPTFDNRTGVISLQGVIPSGINVESGIVTRLMFRVVSTGSAVVEILSTSQVLAHDGTGDDTLEETNAGVYNLVLPPPAGPIVASETHPNQSTWHRNRSAVFSWAPLPSASGYSYMISDTPVDIPDNISEGNETQAFYQNLSNGTHYFHLKALRSGVWGGTTHFAVRVDVEPPAEFSVTILPSPRTTHLQPIVEFFTTDAHSGVDRYELKLVPLSKSGNVAEAAPMPRSDSGQPLFIEATSPYVLPELALGSYDVIVRAHDRAGNTRDLVQRLSIVTPFLKPIGADGLEVFGVVRVAWLWIIILGAVFSGIAGYGAWYFKKRHDRIHEARLKKQLPEDLTKKIDELKKYREKYGKTLVMLFMLGSLFFGGTDTALAEHAVLSPPLITAFSQNITNEDIFYIEGKTNAGNIEVTLYLQSLQTGETFSKTIFSDQTGNWFYSHDGFLSGGDYLLWTQSNLGEVQSPPSPQERMTVRKTAIQFGASRVSLEVLYFSLSVFFFITLLSLTGYGVYHAREARRKHRKLLTEIREAEESVRRGFAVLRRDIEAAMAAHRSAHGGRELTGEEREMEARLKKDLAWVEQHIGKEVWDIRDAERE